MKPAVKDEPLELGLVETRQNLDDGGGREACQRCRCAQLRALQLTVRERQQEVVGFQELDDFADPRIDLNESTK